MPPIRRAAAALLALPLALPLAPARAEEEALTPAQRRAVIEVVRQALRDDPAILRGAVEALQAREDAERAAATRAAIAAEADALFRDPADPVRGNPRGAVTLVEFVDPRCGYCRQMQPVLAELLRVDPTVRLVIKDLPILGPASQLASRALLAAHRQGRYGALHDALMRPRGEITEAVLKAEAEKAGIDWARARRDMDDPAIARQLAANLRLARALSIDGTPALVVGDRMVVGMAELPALRALIAGTDGRPGGEAGGR